MINLIGRSTQQAQALFLAHRLAKCSPVRICSRQICVRSGSSPMSEAQAPGPSEFRVAMHLIHLSPLNFLRCRCRADRAPEQLQGQV